MTTYLEVKTAQAKCLKEKLVEVKKELKQIKKEASKEKKRENARRYYQANKERISEQKRIARNNKKAELAAANAYNNVEKQSVKELIHNIDICASRLPTEDKFMGKLRVGMDEYIRKFIEDNMDAHVEFLKKYFPEQLDPRVIKLNKQLN